jgi:tetratricopeptide (TPR) repeat protein
LGKSEKDGQELSRLMEQASLLHKNADFLSAEKIYCKILKLNPYHYEALCGLGRLNLQKCQFEDALSLVKRALLVNENGGTGLRLLGEIQMASGRPLDALESFEKALSITRDDAELHFFRGVILRGLGRNEEALQAYGRTLELVPGKAEVLCNYGNVLHDLGRYDEAISCFEQALQSAPKVSVLHYNRGNSLLSSGRYGEALGSFDDALRLDPGNPGAWSNRSNALRMMGSKEDALASADRALVIQPGFAEALISRGNALLDLNKPQEAKTAFQQAVNISPQDGGAHNGLGAAMQRLGSLDEAALRFEHAIKLEPDFVEAHYNLALIRLQQGNFAKAWPEYEARFADSGPRLGLRKNLRAVELFEQLPRWPGPQQKVGGIVSIWSEQGIGDQILFSTMIPELVQKGLQFVYEVDGRLQAAYRRAFPDVNFVSMTDPPSPELTAAAGVLFAGSLPGFFRSSAESFSRQPVNVLKASPVRVRHYQQHLAGDFKVALSWRSTRPGRLGLVKSAALADFTPVLRVPGAQFVDVQYGDTSADRMTLPAELRPTRFDEVDHFNDLDEVLAILDACDLLITTSNANAHLAGAMGKPVWLLYPEEKPPCHYWAHRGDHRCLWYPSVEIISGTELKDWPQLATVAAERLRNSVAAKAG